MSNLKINETPLRTAKNYKIKNIIIEESDIPKKIEKFNNFKVSKLGSKITIDENVSKVKLKYGLEANLTNQVIESANYKASIAIDSKTHKEAEIDFDIDKTNPNLVGNIEITANEGTKSTIILKYETSKDVKAYHNSVIRANARKNAVLNIIIVNFINELSNNFIAIQNEIGENAKVNYCIIDFGGKNSITNYFSNISRR